MVRHCELPGCSIPIEDVPGRPARRYCGPEHRAAARRSRRAATATEQAARLSQVLPWVPDPTGTPAVPPALVPAVPEFPAASTAVLPVPAAPAAGVPLVAVPPVSPPEAPVSAVAPEAPAAPAAEVPVSPVVAAAPAATVPPIPAVPAATVPPILAAPAGAHPWPAPAAVPDVAPASPAAGPASAAVAAVPHRVPDTPVAGPAGGWRPAAPIGDPPRRPVIQPVPECATGPGPVSLFGPPFPSVVRPGDRRAPRRRGLALLGAAAVLAGSYTVTSADSASTPPVVPVQVAPVGETHAQWAERARRALDSMNAQLDLIADTEIAWNRAAETQRAAARSAPIEALRERKLLLLQRQASLRSQLEIYAALQEAQRQLALAEQQLATIEAELGTIPPVGQRTPDQELTAARLTAQRDLQLVLVEARRAEVARLEQAVIAAARSPLPADDRYTALVSDLVIGSLNNDGKPAQPGGPHARRPEGIVDRAGSILTRVRYDIPNGAPPDPRGPRDEPGRTVNRAAGGVRKAARPVTRAATPVARTVAQPAVSSGGFGGYIADAVVEGTKHVEEQERASNGDSTAESYAGSGETVRSAVTGGSVDTSDIEDWAREDSGADSGSGGSADSHIELADRDSDDSDDSDDADRSWSVRSSDADTDADHESYRSHDSDAGDDDDNESDGDDEHESGWSSESDGSDDSDGGGDSDDGGDSDGGGDSDDSDDGSGNSDDSDASDDDSDDSEDDGGDD